SLGLSLTRERRELAYLHVVGDAFTKLERAMLAPDLSRFPRHAPVGRDALLRYRHDESVDIGHASLLKPLPSPSSAWRRSSTARRSGRSPCRSEGKRRSRQAAFALRRPC